MGGMTVAALKPMRSLPFRVIAVVGLDDGVFPRRERRAAFDLLEQERRPGDRDLRSDDRQLFLDLAAGGGGSADPRLQRACGERQHAACSLGGAGGTARPPRSPRGCELGRDRRAGQLVALVGASIAAVLAELLRPRPRPAPVHLLTRAGAGGERVGATRAMRSKCPSLRLAESSLRSMTVAQRFELSLRDLTDCWTNPSRYFCRRTLRLSLGGDDGTSPTTRSSRQARWRRGGFARACSPTHSPESATWSASSDGSSPMVRCRRSSWAQVWHERLVGGGRRSCWTVFRRPLARALFRSCSTATAGVSRGAWSACTALSATSCAPGAFAPSTGFVRGSNTWRCAPRATSGCGRLARPGRWWCGAREELVQARGASRRRRRDGRAGSPGARGAKTDSMRRSPSSPTRDGHGGRDEAQSRRSRPRRRRGTRQHRS